MRRMAVIARVVIGSEAISFGPLSKSILPIVLGLGLVPAEMIVVLNAGVMVFW